jgi:hypothetical protein
MTWIVMLSMIQKIVISTLMTWAKYANRLYKIGLGGLAQYNLDFFKGLAISDKRFNKHKSYRLVANNGQLFLRGITSVDRYFEYGVDFTFVVAMLTLHKDMKENEGNQYAITSGGVSESKLELFVTDKRLKDAGEFGKVRSALAISTNDLGQGSLNFTKIIRVGGHLHNGMYLFPNNEKARKKTVDYITFYRPEKRYWGIWVKLEKCWLIQMILLPNSLK